MVVSQPCHGMHQSINHVSVSQPSSPLDLPNPDSVLPYATALGRQSTNNQQPATRTRHLQRPSYLLAAAGWPRNVVGIDYESQQDEADGTRQHLPHLPPQHLSKHETGRKHNWLPDINATELGHEPRQAQVHAAHSRPAGPNAEAHASRQLRPSTSPLTTPRRHPSRPYAVIPNHDNNNNAHTRQMQPRAHTRESRPSVPPILSGFSCLP